MWLAYTSGHIWTKKHNLCCLLNIVRASVIIIQQRKHDILLFVYKRKDNIETVWFLPGLGYSMVYLVLHCGHDTCAVLFPACFSSIHRCRHIWCTHWFVPRHRHGRTHRASRSSSSVAKHTQQVLQAHHLAFQYCNKTSWHCKSVTITVPFRIIFKSLKKRCTNRMTSDYPYLSAHLFIIESS